MKNTSNLHYYTILLFFTSPIVTIAIDTITSTQPLTYNQTIISPSQEFELGFFNPGNSKWYVGIWYKKIPTKTIVWVLNRDHPLTNSTGASLNIGQNGSLVLLDNSSNVIWSSNQTNGGDTIAQLLDTGNFVVKQENDFGSENYIWQSFDYPTDTLLPDMNLGWDRKTGINRYLRSWKGQNDPSSGDYTFKIEINGFPEIYLRNKEEIVYRSGPWNGVRFSGVPEMKPLKYLTFSFVMDQNEVYYSFHIQNRLLYSILVMSHTGNLQRFAWIPKRNLWNPFWYAPKDQCDGYKQCGTSGICDTNSSPVCECMIGFEPKNVEAWNLRDGSDGCVRRRRLNCRDDGFLVLKNLKLPESTTTFMDKMMTLDHCETICRDNCSCTAYSSLNISGGGNGSGCVIWTGELVDIRQYAVAEGGQDLFIKLAASELGTASQLGGVGSKHGSEKTKEVEVISFTVGISILLTGLTICIIKKRRALTIVLKEKIRHKGPRERSQDVLLNECVISRKRDHSGDNTTEEVELPLFEFDTIMMATNNFSDENKIGEGGFGCVYKGVLVGGENIAVKRLSKNSGQGIEEFKNEMRLIARLQHRNLVRLLGCCIEMEEKLLIYEYMENKSLDSILFGKEQRSLLNWRRRFNIICGIARGLLYLHEDSRFRIVHRDLKASNILLDKKMNPKISDFGMARIFGGDQTQANTMRIVGTYGYMAPEYAMDGLFSVKSDVFSFGVLVLEIVSGAKNRGFYYANNQHNLLAHAWNLWTEGKGLELRDLSAGGSYSIDELMRCVQVGLLCVQEQAEDRPTMSTVMLMLSSDNAALPQPKHPGFCIGKRPVESDSSSSKQDESFTLNQLTVTVIDGR